MGKNLGTRVIVAIKLLEEGTVLAVCNNSPLPPLPSSLPPLPSPFPSLFLSLPPSSLTMVAEVIYQHNLVQEFWGSPVDDTGDGA